MTAQARRCLGITSLIVLLASTAVTCTPPGRQALASATAIACSEVSHTPGDYVVEVESSGQIRQFRLHIPPSYQPSSLMPLVINLHGYSSNATQQEILSGMSAKADEAGFIAAHPEGRGTPQAWHVEPGSEGQEDVQFMRDLIHCLEVQLSVDSTRVYAAGFSNGGGMAHRLGCDLSGVIAAIGPVSGAYLFSKPCQPSRPVPVISFHGTADAIVPYEGIESVLPPISEWAADWAARNGCSPTPTVTYSQGDVVGETWGDCANAAVVTLYTIKGGGHTWPGSNLPGATEHISATDTIWEFFAAHSLPCQLYLPFVLRAY